MTFDKYQKEALKTAIYGAGNKINYPILGLVGEAGELANKYKKVLRDDDGILHPDKRKALIDEAADCLWYLAALANDLNSSLEEMGKQNLDKLKSRQERGKIGGSGDNR